MGLTPKEYYSMSRAQYILAFRGYVRKHYKDWERTRLVAYTSYAVAPKKGNNKKITDWLPLPSDEDYKTAGSLSSSLIEQANKEYESIMAQQNDGRETES